MKFYVNVENDVFYIVSETKIIKAIYKSICRACRKGTTDIKPLFCDFPIFKGDAYALAIDEQGYMTVVNANISLLCIAKGDWIEV